MVGDNQLPLPHFACSVAGLNSYTGSPDAFPPPPAPHPYPPTHSARTADPEWTRFSRAAPSWLAFAPGGGTANEDLSAFEATKLDLVFAGHGPDESGEDVLGVSLRSPFFFFFFIPFFSSLLFLFPFISFPFIPPPPSSPT